MDTFSLIINLLGFVTTIIIFVKTSYSTRKATEDQTRRECVRATLSEFTAIRRKHQDFENAMEREDWTDVLKSYLSDLERFAVGCSLKAYATDVINSMSGGMLTSHYDKYFKAFITERRRLASPDAYVKPWTMYTKYEEMMRDIFEIRGMPWEEPLMRTEEMAVLDKFLHMRVSTAEDVFAAFRGIEGAVEAHGQGKEGYIYIPGTRKDRCLIVAHADTYYDEIYQEKIFASKVGYREGYYYSDAEECGIGADDRAGCAMLWLLRESGHSLLVLDGEEHGQIGARYLKDSNPSLFEEINAHSFILQLDRRGSNDYKYYHMPVTKKFVKYVKKSTGFTLAQGKGKTDICVLCTKVCGVNLSVGYYDEHKPTERLCRAEWLHTYNIVKNMLKKPLKRYLLEMDGEKIDKHM